MKYLMKLFMLAAYHASQILNFLFRPVTVGVRLLMVKDGAVLLVKHTYQREWYFPGGGVKRGETLEQAARREAREEVGAELGVVSLFGLYTNVSGYKSDHIAAFICEDFNLSGITDHEIERFGFFGFGDLPEETSSGTRSRVEEYKKGEARPLVRSW